MVIVIPDELVRRWINAGQPQIDSYLATITGMIIRCFSGTGRLVVIGAQKRVRELNQEEPNF